MLVFLAVTLFLLMQCRPPVQCPNPVAKDGCEPNADPETLRLSGAGKAQHGHKTPTGPYDGQKDRLRA